jgi:hypothetical protein
MLGNVPYNIILSNIKNNISLKWMVTFNTVYLNLHNVFCQSDDVNGLNDMTPNRLWKDNVLSRYMLFVNKIIKDLVNQTLQLFVNSLYKCFINAMRKYKAIVQVWKLIKSQNNKTLHFSNRKWTHSDIFKSVFEIYYVKG